MIKRNNPAGRNSLSTLFKGIGAEIGVEKCKYSEVIMETACEMYAVDLWKNYGNYRQHVSDQEYEEIFASAKKRMAGKDVHFVRMDSVAAASVIEGELDWIYIDAAHDRDSVTRDMEAWYPKLKSGGIFAGHDYVAKKGFGVIGAVDAFCLKHNIDELVIYSGDRSPSWMFVKP
jgi:uncharacterized LabA/DUF88 family protein